MHFPSNRKRVKLLKVYVVLVEYCAFFRYQSISSFSVTKKQESCLLSVVSKSLLLSIYSQFSEEPFEYRSMPSVFKTTVSPDNCQLINSAIPPQTVFYHIELNIECKYRTKLPKKFLELKKEKNPIRYDNKDRNAVPGLP